MPQSQVPSVATLRTILKKTFHLKFGKLMSANLKYSDPGFNEKRLWVSRLLAQFYLENIVIISIDESNFRSDTLPSKQWNFNPLLGKRKLR